MSEVTLKNKLFFLLVDDQTFEEEVMKSFREANVFPQVVHSAEEAIQLGSKMKVDFLFCDEDNDESEDVLTKIKTNNLSCRRVFIRKGENPDKELDLIALPFDKDELIDVLFPSNIKRLEDEKTISGKTIFLKNKELDLKCDIIRFDEEAVLFSLDTTDVEPEELKNSELLYGEEHSDDLIKLEGEFLSVDCNKEDEITFIEFKCSDKNVITLITDERANIQNSITEFIKKK
jgi:predicted peroxiredoxin